MSGFSDREVQLMACAFQAMKAPPEIDYQVMARLAGMSNPGSASNAMRAIRRKLDARVPGTGSAAANGSPGTPAKKTPRTGGTGKKRTAATMMSTGSFFGDDAEADAETIVESPSKKKSKAKSRANGGEDDDGAVKVKKEKRGEEDEAEEEEEDSYIEEV
ncbi:hypothetical protein SLS58_005198 [Diplodia intermedia]|uniref:Uncharacterized protein n=1 Tax=Diplodia intermedia TaxID=856260 RepID=A0ABR3TS75_9PEZI